MFMEVQGVFDTVSRREHGVSADWIHGALVKMPGNGWVIRRITRRFPARRVLTHIEAASFCSFARHREAGLKVFGSLICARQVSGAAENALTICADCHRPQWYFG